MGQGSDTGMAQIVGEVLNVPAESVRVVARDTDITPYDMGTLGSRSMFHMGHAVRLAAEEARQKIGELRREVGEPEGSNTPVSGLFIKKYGMKAGNIVGSGSYRPEHVEPDHETGLSPEITPFWMVAATGAEIEVDTETGRVRILKLINAVDCGTQGQSAHRRDADFRRRADAARLHHVGEDEFRRRPGDQRVARRLQDHRHRRFAGRDDQRGDRRVISTMRRSAPRVSAKSSTMPVSPAIANAIDDAVGVRLTTAAHGRGRVPCAAREGRPAAGGRIVFYPSNDPPTALSDRSLRILCRPAGNR